MLSFYKPGCAATLNNSIMSATKIKIGMLALMIGSNAVFARTKIIAHQGYWDCAGSARNSVAALGKAQEIKVYGSEFDVHLTRDGVLVVFHDDAVNGKLIEDHTYAELKDVTLANGEKLPTLEQYLQQGKKAKGTRLILEVKPHKDKATEDRAVAAILALVKQHRAEAITEYISFSLNVCKALVRLSPGVRVAYLKGDLAPQDLKDLGCSGLDYHYKVIGEHPDWIKAAQALGMTVNVWTVNDPAIVKMLISEGVDYITTDKPVEMTALLR